MAPSRAAALKARFGVYADVRLGARADARAALRRLEDTAQLAEAAGLETLFVGEAHPANDSESDVAAPLLMLAAVAARTSLRLGAGALLAPLWSPLKLAEHVALLERLSPAGFTLGLGLGQPQVLARYTAGPQSATERLEAVIAGVPRVWAEGLSWPPPRRPVEILVAGGVSASARRGGLLGDGWYASSILPLRRLGELAALCKSEAATAGQPRPRIACNRVTVVAASDGAAWRIAGRHVAELFGSYARHGALRDPSGAPVAPSADPLAIAADRLLVGSPATVARLLAAEVLPRVAGPAPPGVA